jgi:hypothetical protein
MGASERDGLPQDSARARHQFQAWRCRRQTGGRIPHRLWALAVRLGGRYGVSRTASVLRLDYYSLKERVEAAASEPPPCSPAFVELPSPVVVGKRCLFELDSGVGATLRVQLVGYDTADIEVLAHRFWNAKSPKSNQEKMPSKTR